MPNPFEWTAEEKSSVTGEEQYAMLQRLVDFVNERLAEIKTIQTDVNTVKEDIEEIKNPTTPK
jgi:prefoldin subunit 5